MTRTSLKDFNCSLAQAAEVIGDKWTLLILREAFFGTSSFSEFRKNLGVAKTVLSDRLQSLVDHGVLERAPTRPGVDRHTYRLTAAGKDFFPALVTLMQWSDKWVFGPGNEPLCIMDKETRSAVQQVGVQARDGHFLTPRETTFGPGPGANEETLQAFASLKRGNRSP